MLRDTLSTLARNRFLSDALDVRVSSSVNFCALSLHATTFYDAWACGSCEVWREFCSSTDSVPSRWQRWSDRHWHASTSLDVCTDSLLWECPARTDVVCVSDSYFPRSYVHFVFDVDNVARYPWSLWQLGKPISLPRRRTKERGLTETYSCLRRFCAPSGVSCDETGHPLFVVVVFVSSSWPSWFMNPSSRGRVSYILLAIRILGLLRRRARFMRRRWAGVLFFLRVTALNPFFTPYPATPLTAPKAAAFPAAVKRGMRAAKGRIPSLWPLLVPLRRLFLGGMLLRK